jgi:thiamine-phosphate pyrophosphorylase
MRRAPLDLSIYLVADTAACGQFGVAATVSAAVAGGVLVVQLRDEDATDEELVAVGREVMTALRDTDVTLIINNRVHLVDAIGAHGAHVGQTDLEITEARAMLGSTRYLGLSVQNVEHVITAKEHDIATLDYLGVGPVWETATKHDAAAGGLNRLHQIVLASPWPCVAIGGVNLERLIQLRRAGAAGAAVVSAICGKPDVTAATRSLRAAWDDASE